MTPFFRMQALAPIAWLLAFFLWNLPAAEAQESSLQGFEAYVEQARQAWDVPGLAVAVVKDNAVAFARGYGVRQLGSPEPVDTHTLFSIGSTTKAFTAAALALLVDEGKINWDEPVVTYLPGFRVADPYVTRELRVRDLITHRNGVEPTDMLWVAGYDRDDIVRRLRHARQVSSLRSRWQYNNGMYVVAGAVIEAVSGTSWEQFVRDRILGPLGMDATLMISEGIETHPNAAMAHDEIEDTLRVLPYPHIDAAGPAGSMQSSVADMARWIAFMLDDAKANDRRLLKPATYAELFKPQMHLERPIYPAVRQANSHFFAYGLGWFLQDYRGHLLVMHTGSIWGMSAIVGLLPEEDLGVVVLANRDHAELRHALMYEVFDRYLGTTGKDWSGDLLNLYSAIQKQAAQAQKNQETSRVAVSSPTLPLENYTGVYVDSLYGEVKVSLESSGLTLHVMHSKRLVADLKHWHYDTFRVVFRDRRMGNRQVVRFELDATGDVHEIDFVGFTTFGRKAGSPSRAGEAFQ